VLVEYFNGQDLFSSGAPELTNMEALARAVCIWRQTALAVAFANAREVYHCDVNPSNILVSPPTQVLGVP
jgi:serine/threonine protein kinase